MAVYKYPRIIYAIQHSVTKRIYIGSTAKTIGERYYVHITRLKNNKHSVSLMQEDFNIYGEHYDVYKLGIIESFNERHKEYEEMVKYNTLDIRYGYNQGDAKRCKHIIKTFENQPLNIKKDLSDIKEHWRF